jgi:hypothetical protein
MPFAQGDIRVLKRGSVAVAIVLMLGIVQGTAEGQDKRPNPGLVMWSAFKCATYAELSGDEREQKRLFDIGYSAGKSFFDGIKNQTISEAKRREAPVGVLLRSGGPSIDFMIGRVFEGAVEDAYDKVVKEDNSGLPILDPSKWADGELKVIKAQNKYRGSNCALIK